MSQFDFNSPAQREFFEQVLERNGFTEEYLALRYPGMLGFQVLDKLLSTEHQANATRMAGEEPSIPQVRYLEARALQAREMGETFIAEQCDKVLSQFDASKLDFNRALTVCARRLPDLTQNEKLDDVTGLKASTIPDSSGGF